MNIVIAGMIALSLGWLCLLLFQAMERAYGREKWLGSTLASGPDSLLFQWNRPLIELARPIFKKTDWGWSFWLGLETAILADLYFGWKPSAVISGFYLGAGYPWIWRWVQKKKRLEAIRLELPFVIDLLAVAVQAGMDWIQAIQKIAADLPPSPLILEFKNFLSDLEVGQSRKEALLALKKRVGVVEIHPFISLLLQALKLGSPLAPVLQSLASQMRDRRLLNAERLGMQASLKILFPLVFCILPAVFLTIFAPLALRYFSEGG